MIYLLLFWLFSTMASSQGVVTSPATLTTTPLVGARVMTEIHSTENTPVEMWKPVVGFPGYEVSDQGRVRSFWKIMGRGRGGGGYCFIGDTPRVKKTPINRHGYAEVSLCRQGNCSRTRLVHRLVLEAFVGACPVGMEACHGPGGSANNRLVNLCWGTACKNHGEDRLRDGTDNRGEKHGMCVLTVTVAKAIRSRLRDGAGLSQIAREFGVARHNVKNIRDGRAWAWLLEEGEK